MQQQGYFSKKLNKIETEIKIAIWKIFPLHFSTDFSLVFLLFYFLRIWFREANYNFYIGILIVFWGVGWLRGARKGSDGSCQIFREVLLFYKELKKIWRNIPWRKILKINILWHKKFLENISQENIPSRLLYKE